MADHEIREKIVMEGADEAASALSRIGGAAGRVANAFGGLANIAGVAGGIAGVMKVAETVQETEHLYQAIIRVKGATNLAAEEAHAIFDEFELSGIAMEDAERTMVTLARLSGKMSGSATITAEQSQKLQSIMTRLGISVKAGPQQRLEEMSKAAKSGKLGVQDLISAFAIPRSSAGAMMAMLKQGPEKLKGIYNDTLKSSDLIDEAALDNYQTMAQTRRELADAWGGLVGVLYKSLMPAITEILTKFKEGFEAAEPTVVRIGEFLKTHMTQIVALTKTWIALMTGNKIVNLLTGGNLGVAGRFAAMGKGMWAMAGARSGAHAIYGPMMAANPFMASGRFGKVATNLGFMSSSGGALGGVGQFFGKIMGSTIGKLGVIGVVVGAIAAVFNGIMHNSFGIRDTFMRIGSKIGELFHRLMPVFEVIGGIIGKIASVVGDVLVIAVDGIALVLEKIIDLIGLIGDMLEAINKKATEKGLLRDIIEGAVGGSGAVNVQIDQYRATNEVWKAARAAWELAKKSERKTDKGKGEQVYQDFRGSKFDITNNFPKDVDGGRVAVVFGDELAQLGERRIDSGLRPIYSYR